MMMMVVVMKGNDDVLHRSMERLTVLCFGGAAAIATNVLDFFPDVAVNDEGHGAVLVLLFPGIRVPLFTV